MQLRGAVERTRLRELDADKYKFCLRLAAVVGSFAIVLLHYVGYYGITCTIIPFFSKFPHVAWFSGVVAFGRQSGIASGIQRDTDRSVVEPLGGYG